MWKFCLALVAVVFFATQASAETKLRCRSNGGHSAYFIDPTPGYDHDRYGTFPHDLMFQFEAFVASFDSADRDGPDATPDLLADPEWVAYEIKRYGDGPPFSAPTPSPERPSPWYEMSALSFLANQPGVTTSDVDESYSGFGTAPGLPGFGIINRGHLAMKAHAQRISWKAACDTHVFVNAVPQQMELNQGDWLDLEAYSGAAANKFGQVWVIAGPIFTDKDHPRTMATAGEIPVAVPDALFKILIKEGSTNLPDVLAFIYPQPSTDYVLCSQASGLGHVYDPAARLVSVAEIEAATGLEFFRNVKFANIAARNAFKAAVASSLWTVEEEFYGFKCGG